MTDTLLDELCDWLRIPSISSGGGDPADLQRAAEWACERIVAAGGSGEVLSGYGNPLCVGELRSRRADAPTVLIYGHYDVQSPEPRSLWTSDPFDPVVRDGRLYARGASDDKGNFLPLLHVACDLARSGDLPVHVRVLLEGEEEVGGTGVLRYMDEDERRADCAIVFDGAMVDEQRPALHIAVRGVIVAHVRVRTASRDLHSGVYGGVALSAPHVLTKMLAEVVAGPDGRLRDELRAGLRSPGPDEIASWGALPPGPEVLAAAGAREIAPGAAAELYARTWADTSLDVNGIESGDAVQRRTIIPCTASARLTVRLALGQNGEEIARGAGAHPARRGAPGRGGRARHRAGRSGRLRRDRSGARAGARGDRPGRGQRAAVRAHRRLDPDPRGVREAPHPDRAVGLRAGRRRHPRPRRELPAARASPSASGPRTSSTRPSRRSMR